MKHLILIFIFIAFAFAQDEYYDRSKESKRPSGITFFLALLGNQANNTEYNSNIYPDVITGFSVGEEQVKSNLKDLLSEIVKNKYGLKEEQE